MWLKDQVSSFLYRFGYINEKEVALRSIPQAKKKRFTQITSQLNSVKVLSNPQETFKLTSELQGILKEIEPRFNNITKNEVRIQRDAVRLIGGDLYGYRPAAAKLYGLFQNNPFGIYSFVARHHWAVRTALQVVRDELVDDGFQLIGQKGTTKKRLRDVYRQLKALGLFELRINLCSHIKLFGNAWVLPHKNLLGGPQKFELLAPPRLMPVIDPITDQIMGWEYSVGRTTITYPRDKLFQIYQYTVDNYKDIGDPPLTPAILAIEADLAGESYTNQQFQRGGFMGLILNMKTDSSDPIARDAEDVVDDLQDKIDAQFAGVKAAQTVMVTTNLESATQLKPPTENVFDQLHQMTAKTVAQCLGVPPEKIAISRSATLQYIPGVVEDTVNAQFDKSINALLSLVDEFLNDQILTDMLGITDVRIIASGRYGAMTLNAANTIKILADAGPLITVNQALDRILGWEPLAADNPRGNMVLDNSMNRDPMNAPLTSEESVEDPNFGKAWLGVSGITDQRIGISSKEFVQWTETVRRGTFERKEVSDSPDYVECRVAKFKAGELKFYE